MRHDGRQAGHSPDCAQTGTRIDAHQHFWATARGDYPWMPTGGPLRTDHLPEQLDPLNRAAGITGTVVVQAAPTTAETEFLLDLADDPDSTIVGIVGWVPLHSARGLCELERLAADPRVVGIRATVRERADPTWISQPQVIENLRQARDLGLTCDLVCPPDLLPHAHHAITQVPGLRVVIDQLGQPDPAGRNADQWLRWMSVFATRPATTVKLSGMPTGTLARGGLRWVPPGVRADVETVLEAYGAGRVMFGSNWPMCLPDAEHQDVIALAQSLTGKLSPDERDDIWWRTATWFYQLPT